MIRIEIQVTEEWNHMYAPSEYFRYSRRPFQRASVEADRVGISEPYSELCGEPVWFYSWGNARWLRCPMGIPGDVLNDHGDRIHSVDVELVDVNKAKGKPGRWVSAESALEAARRILIEVAGELTGADVTDVRSLTNAQLSALLEVARREVDCRAREGTAGLLTEDELAAVRRRDKLCYQEHTRPDRASSR